MASELGDRRAGDARRLLAQAHYELHKKGDRLQASDKAAGAVAHAVKAIGCDRQWRHDSHNLRRQIVNLLAAEFGQPELNLLQGDADQVHGNFYEDRLHEWELSEYLSRITAGMELLWAVRARGNNPDFIPSPGQQRAIERLLLIEEEAAALPLIDYPPPLPPFVPPEDDDDGDDLDGAKEEGPAG